MKGLGLPQALEFIEKRLAVGEDTALRKLLSYQAILQVFVIIEDSYKKLDKEHRRRKNKSGAHDTPLSNPLELGNREGDLEAPLLS